AGGVEDRVLHPEEARDGRLELLVDGLGAADEAHAGEAQAPAGQTLLGRPHQGRLVGEAEVVVGAEVEHLAPGHRDARVLGALDDALALPEPGLPDAVELRPQALLGLPVHGWSSGFSAAGSAGVCSASGTPRTCARGRTRGGTSSPRGRGCRRCPPATSPPPPGAARPART